MTVLYICIAIFFSLITIALIAFFWIRRKLSRVSKQLFNNENIIDALQDIEKQDSTRPKSLSSRGSIVIDKIEKDFNNLSMIEFERLNRQSVQEVFSNLEKQIYAKEDALYSLNQYFQQFEIQDTKIHKQVIHDYIKEEHCAKLTFQVALQYLMKISKTQEKLVQDRIQCEWIFTFDDANFEHGNSSVLHCPNCNGEISNLQLDICEYCGSHILVDYKKTWKLNTIKRV